MEVRNCKQCGRLFSYIGKTMCPECLKDQEDEFTVVKNYIRKHPSAGIADVSEATGASVKQIRQWVREERLILTEVSATAGINCDSCGRPIQTGKLCPACKKQMTQSLSQAYATQPKEEEAAPKTSGKDRMRYLSKNNK